ncbi:MAG TPA: NRDE family protein [Caulobacteraceae bacterium]|nr:NRDE family protein [Caulobacteraceae bacterium]
MCVLALAWRAHPEWRLVLAGNRDERHARPAQPLQRWPDAPGVLAGRDVQSGGSWLGVSEAGRFAVVTNLSGFGPPTADRPSRGDLVKDALIGDGRYADLTVEDAETFNPFNLVTVSGDQALFWRNRPEVQRRLIAPGVLGLSNGQADRPWPKTLQLTAAVAAWLEGTSPPEAMLEPLGDDVPPPGAASMTERGAQTGVFVRNADYGTRCSTVVAIDVRGRGLIVERRFDAEGRRAGQTRLTFRWPAEAA